jgi:hypothetical protein
MVRTVQIIFQEPNGQDLVLEWFRNVTYCNGLASVLVVCLLLKQNDIDELQYDH